jgi:hypothetical protein
MSYIDEEADDERIEEIETILQDSAVFDKEKKVNTIPSILKEITDSDLRNRVAKALIKEYVRRDESWRINEILAMIDSSAIIKKILANETGEDEVEYSHSDYEFEEAGDSPHFLDDYLLIIAVQKGQDDLVKSLVEKGADVNVVGQNDKLPALHEAAYIGNVDMLKYLIANGADKKFKARDGTAIDYARMGNREGKMDEKKRDEVIRILRGAQEGGRRRTRRRVHIKKSRTSTKRQTMRRK